MAFSERVSRLKSSLIREILAAAQRPQMMSFAGGLPAEAMLPKVDWARMPVSMGQYGMSEGESALREALAAEARALGVPCEASQVLVVSGSQQTLDLAAKLYIDKGTGNPARGADLSGGVADFPAVRRRLPDRASGGRRAEPDGATRSAGATPSGLHLPDPDLPESIGGALQRSQARRGGGVAR